MNSRTVLCWLIVSAATTMNAGQIEFKSSTNQTQLLELYTSEGCSSCPPAEAWLSKLKDDPKLWQDFVPVAFHVDYWDYLGWRDPFGSADYSARQRRHAAAWGSRTVYTPGFVLNGKEWRAGFDRKKLTPPAAQPAGILTARSEDGRNWALTFRPQTPQKSCSFNVALLGSDLTIDVKAGENGGRKLQHDFVVLAFSTTRAKLSGEIFEATVKLSPPDSKRASQLAIAAWVTEDGKLQPLQAVGGSLAAK